MSPQATQARASKARYFRLTAGATADDAIDWVERCGHTVVRAVLTRASSVALYGICEIAPPAQPSPEPNPRQK